MIDETHGWRAAFDHDLYTDTQRLILWRYVGDDVEVLAGFDDTSHALFNRHPRNETGPADVGVRLPVGALGAIAEAVKPGPSTGELAVLREWLAVERDRTDLLISATLKERK